MAEEKQTQETVEIDNASSSPTENSALSEKELYEFLNAARQIFNTYNYDGGTYTPFLTNARLSEIGFSPEEIKPSELKKALKDPIAHQDMMTAYSEWLSFADSISKRTVSYMGNLPSFDYTFVCINAPDNREDATYKQDLEIVKKFLNKFDVKGEFAKIHRRTLINDAYYGIFRMDAGENFVFQELPSNRCKITGRNAGWGLLYDFDMSWFFEQGLSLNQYPTAMRTLWSRVYKDRDPSKYNPSNKLNKRKGVFSTWAQTSPLPQDGGFTCFKFYGDTIAKTPFLTSLFGDAINKDVVRELQNNQYIIASQKILVGLIPLLKEQKSGQVKDAVAISPTLMSNFLSTLKKGLSDAIKISGVPFDDVKEISYSLPDKNMYDEYNKSLASNSGVTSRIIYSNDKMTAQEILLSTEIDSMISTQVYPQYATWLSSIINSLTSEYKFRFTFEGNNFSSNRKERLETALKLADKGMVDFQKIASACGDNIFTFEERIVSSSYSKLWDRLKLLPNTNTKSEGTAGRPMSEIASDSQSRNNDRVESEE